MKKYLVALLLVAPWLAQAQTAASFTLKGSIGKVDEPAQVYLLQNGRFDYSALLQNGSFKLSGLMDTPAPTMLLLVRNGNLQEAFGGANKVERTFFFLEPGTTTFTSADSLQHATITGSKLTGEHEALFASLAPTSKKLQALMAQYPATPEQQQQSPELVRRLDAQRIIIEQEEKQLLIAHIKAHPTSYVSLDALQRVGGAIPNYAEIEPLYAGLAPQIRGSAKGKQYGELLQVIKKASGSPLLPDSARVASAVAEYQDAQQEARIKSAVAAYQDAQQKQAQAQRTAQLQAYIKANPGAPASLQAVQTIGGPFPEPTTILPLFNSLSPALQNSPEGKQYSELLQQRRDVAIGAMAPNFTSYTPEGKLVALKDYRGKYVLVDFWASWCGPCRLENPNVTKAYSQYKKKNFDVLSVSLDTEKERAKWLKAVQNDSLAWTQVSDLKGWESPVAQRYHVQAIPQNFLVDPNGKIVATNLRGDDLQEALAKIIK